MIGSFRLPISLTSSGDTTAPTIVTAKVEDANPDKLVVVFSEVVTITNTTGLTITGAATPTLSAPTGSGSTTITFTLSTALTNGQSVTLNVASSNTIKDAANNSLAATTKAITNNVAVVSSYEPPIAGLVANYAFDEVTGNLIDSVNSMNGVLNGTFNRDGTKYTFNGVNSYIAILDNDNLGLIANGENTSFNFRFKITFDDLAANGWIITKRDSSNKEWEIFVYQDNLNIAVFDGIDDSNSVGASIPMSSFVAGVEYHVVLNHNNERDVQGRFHYDGYTAYVNKISIPTSKYGGFYLVNPSANTTAPLTIGRAEFNQGLYFGGSLSDLRINVGYHWTESEVIEDYNQIM